MKAFLLVFLCVSLWADVYGTVRGVIHDPHHRPIAGAHVVLQAETADYSIILTTNGDGIFEAVSVPTGAYRITAAAEGFADVSERVVATSGHTLDLHFSLPLASGHQEVDVQEAAPAATVAPETVVSRAEIQATPGADLTNSLAAITDYVPGAWMAHDQLHVRGGHQVTWAIDGVPIPNTNIASNVGPQIDPKDIDYLEAERGGYSAAYGDRTYAVFNAVPRTGFERSREADLVTTFGSFHQTNDQLSLGDHSEKFAWFASLDGNRSDYGLETPGPDVTHDRAWGLSGMTTLVYNLDASNQFRFVGSARRDDYQIPGDSSDTERERDALAVLSWTHSFSPGVVLNASPFYHANRANYDGSATDHRLSQYGGVQVSLNAVTHRHNFEAGVYGYGQSDSEALSVGEISQARPVTGYLEAVFAGDQYKPASWLTLSAGLRLTHASGTITENAASPRTGAALRIPRLGWILHGSWGRYYQAPPLSTVSGPLLEYAATQGFGFIPLYGERDEEHQFGLTIPLRGWAVEIDNYHQRARNYFDHNALGDSNVFFPLTIAGARLYGWEWTLRSPQLWHRGEIAVSYAYAHAEGAGAVTGGLTDFTPPDSGYFPLDHDQRHTLHTAFHFRVPGRVLAGGNLYYGSGFPDAEGHTTFDVSLGRAVTETWTISLTALNVGNRRFLLDNSPTFGGTHYADPRQVYVEVRKRFQF